MRQLSVVCARQRSSYSSQSLLFCNFCMWLVMHTRCTGLWTHVMLPKYSWAHLVNSSDGLSYWYLCWWALQSGSTLRLAIKNLSKSFSSWFLSCWYQCAPKTGFTDLKIPLWSFLHYCDAVRWDQRHFLGKQLMVMSRARTRLSSLVWLWAYLWLCSLLSSSVLSFLHVWWTSLRFCHASLHLMLTMSCHVGRKRPAKKWILVQTKSSFWQNCLGKGCTRSNREIGGPCVC